MAWGKEALSVQHSAFSTQRSALSVQHSAFSTQHSATAIALWIKKEGALTRSAKLAHG
jgi:hypothetical protein